MDLLNGIPWIVGILLLLTFNSDFCNAQRSARLTSTRTFNTKTSNSGTDFDCPEEFGYYPHPSDCTQYYVCVFGGALLESCTGGLMYSHELQTCDWPRNVGCEVVDGASQQQSQSILPTGAGRDVTPRIIPQVKSQQQQQSQRSQQSIQQQTTIGPQRIRFQTPLTTVAPQTLQQIPVVQQQQPQRTLSRQQQQIPQPEFPAPNPIITSRGQPKSLLDSQEDIAKLYAEAHDTLPPAEEEESDRQQRVYRGQPSTLGQVQRDRDGIIHHSNVNALPTHGKIGSFAFGSQISQFSTTPQPSNIFVQQPQQQRPKPVAEPQNTRNTYYNTSNQAYDPATYDSFYSVYDDDVELYRDIEYNNQQQQQQQQQQQPQYTSSQRGRQQPAVIQSTYRPEINTTPTPQVPVREGYVNKQQQQPVHQQQQQQHQQKTGYNQPSLSYNSEYDDALISQIDDSVFNQPARNPPVRGDRYDLNSISDSYSSIRTTSEPPSRFAPIFLPSPTTTTTTTTTVRYTYRPPTTPSTTPFTTTTVRTRPTIVRTTIPTTTPKTTTTTTTTTTTPPPPTTTTTTTTEATTTPAEQTTTKSSRGRTRGGVHYNAGSNSQSSTNEREPSAAPAIANRGTHPPRSRPTLKSKGAIVSKAAEFVDIYKFPPTRPEPLYPQPTPDKTAAKCRKDVCLLPDCSCGGKDIPGEIPVESLPQIVLLTFDDSVNDLNKQLYTDLFEKGRVNPNGCPITATFYVSHEWTDYSQVQNLYAEGHEMASHTVSHSFGEQFSQKKWTREIAGQREILAAYGGVKLEDVRGMRAPFLSIGGNKMFKMLYDSNFTYDSSMPVYENRPPSWPYTLDYKIFHDCMIPPCPTKSYPGVWEVPMVMWQDLNGGRCSMGDACANPPDAENVTKMLMKNFDRHYSTNRAPFGLFYHAAWFTQPHHKEGFIKFLDTINAMDDVWIVTNWQMLQWVRDPTPLSRIKQFQPFQCDYSDRPKRCNNPKVCNLWHKSGVRYMRTCQPCPDIYPWTGKTGIRSSRIDNEIED